jgi:hypothetical protein
MTLKQALWEIVRDENIIITNQNIDWLLDRALKRASGDAQTLKESILERKRVIEDNIPPTLTNEEKVSEKLLINEVKSNNFDVKSNNEIEEMARDICENYNDDGTCYCEGKLCDLKCECFIDAQYLYEKGYRKQSEWISVDERLPEANTQVLAINSDGEFYVATYIEHKISPSARGYMTWASGMYNGKPTHWMPLPEAPKMKGGEE